MHIRKFLVLEIRMLQNISTPTNLENKFFDCCSFRSFFSYCWANWTNYTHISHRGAPKPRTGINAPPNRNSRLFRIVVKKYERRRPNVHNNIHLSDYYNLDYSTLDRWNFGDVSTEFLSRHTYPWFLIIVRCGFSVLIERRSLKQPPRELHNSHDTSQHMNSFHTSE